MIRDISAMLSQFHAAPIKQASHSWLITKTPNFSQESKRNKVSGEPYPSTLSFT